MRIALLTYSTKPRGGVVHTLALAQALARAGQDVSVVTLARGGDGGFFRRVDASVEVELVPFPDLPGPPTHPGEDVGARIVRSIAVMAQALGRWGDRWDVVHAQDCISANAALIAGLACVRTVHHLDTFTTPELVACHERAITGPAAHVCVSASVAGELAAGWGITATVIPNGVDAARFAAASADTPDADAARHGWREQLGTYVLAVGGIEPRKGTLDLVEAMGLLAHTRPDVRLVVAGGETLFDYRDYAAQVHERARRLAVDPVVLGAVDDDALPALVAAAGAFAFPSTKEGFGLAAMEALAAGVPLVARDLPVLREVFEGTAQFASTPQGFARALENALDGARARSTTTAAGRSLAARHTWDAAAAAHVGFYRSRDGAPARAGAQWPL